MNYSYGVRSTVLFEKPLPVVVEVLNDYASRESPAGYATARGNEERGIYMTMFDFLVDKEKVAKCFLTGLAKPVVNALYNHYLDSKTDHHIAKVSGDSVKTSRMYKRLSLHTCLYLYVSNRLSYEGDKEAMWVVCDITNWPNVGLYDLAEKRLKTYLTGCPSIR